MSASGSAAAPLFDFRGDAPLHGSHLQALRTIHLDFCERLSLGLASEGFRLSFDGLSLVTPRAALEGIGPAALIAAVGETRASGLAFVLPRGHALGLIARRLGASEGFASADRGLRLVEQKLLAGWAAEFLLPRYETSWPPLRNLRLLPGAAADAAEALPPLRPEEQFVRVQLTAARGADAGSWSIYIPGAIARTLLESAKAAGSASAAGPAAAADAAVTARLLGAAVRVSVMLDEQRVPLKDLMPLRVGRVLPLQSGPNSELSVIVNGRRLFTATAGRQHNRLAVRISRRAREEDNDAT